MAPRKAYNDPIIEGKMQDYADIFINSYLENFGTSQLHPKVSKIIGFFLFQNILTQKQLRELTGFSMGTISTYLSILEQRGFLKKRTIPGTHTMQYFLPGSYIQYINMLRNNNLKENSKAKGFFQSIKEEMLQIESQNLKGFDLLYSRIIDILNFLEIRERFYHLYTVDPTNENKHNEKEYSLTSVKGEIISPSTEVDLKILQIEEKIVNFVLDSDIFSEYKIERNSVVRILGYVITRKELTNKLLQKLTGLSAGSISQGINLLYSLKMIEKVESTKSSRQLYGMESISLTLLNSLLETRKKRMLWKQLCIETLQELDTNRFELSRLKGYDKAYILILHVLRIFPVYIRQIELIEDAKKSLEKL